MPKKRGNGEGSVVRYKTGWRAIIVIGWRDGTHPIKRTKVFPTAAEARHYISQYRSHSVPALIHSVQDYWNIYRDNGLQKLSSSKITHYKTVWNRISEVAQEDISSLTVARLQELVKGYTYYPARDIKSLLSHLYKLAIADGVCSANLSSFIVLPELNEEETVPFTKEEVERMWADYAEHPETGLALLMTYTGLMPSEVAKVTEDKVDWDRQLITEVGSKTDRRKSAAVPVPDRMVPVLKDLLDKGKNGSVMPYKMDTYRKAFKGMVSRIRANPRCTPYSCRHTFATLLATEVPAHVLAKLMRNDIRVTTKYYVHTDAQTLLDQVNNALR